MSDQYEVLNPWAEVDPIGMRGITRRVDDLLGKKIGLLFNGKRASQPILEVVERAFKDRFPTSEFSYFGPTGNRDVIGSPDESSFRDWAKGVDVVIAAVGD